MGRIRLNKLLASRGVAARRKCDALIQAGEVRVDGKVVTEPGTLVDPGQQRVSWRGRQLPRAPAAVYLMIHKPGGVLTTLDDPQGRRTVADLLPARPRIFPVGRLDAATSGLLLATNDGALAHRLMHPRYGVRKIYRLTLLDPPGAAALEGLARGVRLPDGSVSAPAEVRVRGRRGGHLVLDLAVHEGRYHQVRQMCEALGLRLFRLHRVGYGPLRLGELKEGRVRPLAPEEVRALYAASRKPRDPPPGGRQDTPPRSDGPRRRGRPESARRRWGSGAGPTVRRSAAGPSGRATRRRPVRGVLRRRRRP